MLIIIIISLILLFIYQKGKNSGIEKGYYKRIKEEQNNNFKNGLLIKLWITAIILLTLFLIS